MLTNTKYLFEQLQQRMPELAAKKANDLSNTVFFKEPSPRVIAKYSLATMNQIINGDTKKYAHAIVMPHVSRDVIEEFLSDLECER